MITTNQKDLPLFDKANAAAREAMRDVVDLAKRTGTPVIIYRNGLIERISPDAIPNQDGGTEPASRPTEPPTT